MAEAGRQTYSGGERGPPARMSCPIRSTPPRPAVRHKPTIPPPPRRPTPSSPSTETPNPPTTRRRLFPGQAPPPPGGTLRRTARPAAGPFRADRTDRRRRHGRRHPRPRHPTRPPRGPQDLAAGHGRRSGKRPPLPSGGPQRRPPRPREHRPRLFLRRRPTAAFHRLRVRRGRQPAHHPGAARPIARRRGAALHPPGGRRPGPRRPTRRRSPRHQAVQHHHHAHRPRQARRHGPGPQPRTPGRPGTHPVGRHARHLRLHVAGAGFGAARGRRAQRHLFARLHAVSHAHRPPARPGRHRRPETAPPPAGQTARPATTGSRPAGRRGRHSRPHDGQEAARPLPAAGTVGPSPAAGGASSVRRRRTCPRAF